MRSKLSNYVHLLFIRHVEQEQPPPKDCQKMGAIAARVDACLNGLSMQPSECVTPELYFRVSGGELK